jgi:hypothetical protein
MKDKKILILLMGEVVHGNQFHDFKQTGPVRGSSF